MTSADELKTIRQKETTLGREAAKKLAIVLGVDADNLVLLQAGRNDAEHGFNSVLHFSKSVAHSVKQKDAIDALVEIGVGCTRQNPETPNIVYLSSEISTLAKMKVAQKDFEFSFDNSGFVPTHLKVTYQNKKPIITLNFIANDEKAGHIKEILQGTGKGHASPIQYIDDVSVHDKKPGEMKEQTFYIYPKPGELRTALQQVTFGVEALREIEKRRKQQPWTTERIVQAFDRTQPKERKI